MPRRIGSLTGACTYARVARHARIGAYTATLASGGWAQVDAPLRARMRARIGGEEE